MSNEQDSISPAANGEPNASRQQDIRHRVRKLQEDVKHLSETLDRARKDAAETAEAVAAKRQGVS